MNDVIKIIARGLCPTDDPNVLASYEGDAADVVNALHAAGYTIVPREPSEAMLDAGALIVPRPDGRPEAESLIDAASVYRAMIDAAEGGE